MDRENLRNGLNEVISEAIEKLGSIAKIKTIVGDPSPMPSGGSIIPVSKITLGIIWGGGEFDKKKKNYSSPFAGGSGAVISLKPSAFLVDDGKDVKVLNVANDFSDRIIDGIGEFLKGESDEE